MNFVCRFKYVSYFVTIQGQKLEFRVEPFCKSVAVGLLIV